MDRLFFAVFAAIICLVSCQQPSDCVPGQYYEASLFSCIQCPVATYSSTRGQTQCTPCPTGESTLGQGSTSIDNCHTICQPGNFYDIGRGLCVECSIRYYLASGLDALTGGIRTSCDQCPSDRPLTASTGSTSINACQAQCPDGEELVEFSPNTIGCQACAIGFYRSGAAIRCISCGDGYTTLNTGSTSASQCIRQCPVGQYLSAPDVCSLCPVGQYQDEIGQQQCKDCPSGTSTLQTGATSDSECLNECQPGFALDVFNVCQLCARGSYQPLTGLISVCTPCTTGTTTPTTGSTSSTQCVAICPAGSSRHAVTGACTACPVGTYQPLADQLLCTDCPADSITLTTGSTASSDCIAKCTPGFFRSAGGLCERCPVGTYSSLDEQTTCTTCPDGTTTRQDAATSSAMCVATCGPGTRISGLTCVPCSRGLYQDEEEQNQCKQCPAGLTTENEGSTRLADCLLICEPGFYPVSGQCQPCPLNTYKPTRGDTQCLNCPSGQITLQVGSTSENQCMPVCSPGSRLVIAERRCELCPVNTYQPNTGATTCLSCGTDMITDNPGSTTSADCYRNCAAGQQLVNSQCIFCSMGFYQPLTGQRSCMMCDPPKTTLRNGATSEDECVVHCGVGEYEVSEECLPCPADTYQPAVGADSCLPCPTNTGTYEQTGAVSSSQCLAVCPSGSRLDGTTCRPCAVGEYQDQAGQLDCIRCSAGYSTAETGSTHSSNCKYVCPAGFEQDGNQEQCRPCDRGYYKDSSTVGSCSRCPEGFTTQTQQSTSSTACNQVLCAIGQESDGLRCRACPYNEYQDTPRQENCKKCPEDHITVNEGATSINDCIFSCPPGAEPINGANRCQSCRVGYYKELAGTASCIQCPAEFTTGVAGSNTAAACNIRRCPPGSFRESITNRCLLCGRGLYQNLADQTSCKSCPAGFTTAAKPDGTFGAISQSACFTVDPCSSSEADCHENAECVLHDSRRTCVCKPGFVGNGIDVCVHQCDEPGYCVNGGTCSRTTVGARCDCTDDWTGNRCQFKHEEAEDNTKWILAGVFGGLGFLLLLAGLIALCYYCCRNRNKERVNYITTAAPTAPPVYPPYYALPSAQPNVIVKEVKQEPVVINQSITQAGIATTPRPSITY